ncbi:MAG: hypothetical protein B7Y35_06070 [Sphingomonadales bacterium 28-64-96]|nr:MAG: hypothetical protein B7Y35_06070 [Sphingomonadales bacterium 28-64-96]
MPDAAATIVAEQPVQIARQLRGLSLRAESFNPETRTLDVVASTGSRRATFDWNSWREIDEELEVSLAAIRMDRLNNGAPVLDSHQSYELENQIGVVVPGSARIENGQLICTLQLSARESIAELVADIQAGIIRNISVGYIVHAYEVTETPGARPLYRATDWEPAEISFVPVPADPAAGVRSADAEQGRFPCIIRRAAETGPAIPEATMPEVNDPAAPAAPIVEAAPATTETRGAAPAAVTASAIITACRNAGLTDAVRDQIIARHETSPLAHTDLMAVIGQHYAARNAPATNSRVSVTRDEGDTLRAGVTSALLARMDHRHQLDENGARFRSYTLLDVARDILVSRGVSVNGLSRNEIATRALGMTTSDLPLILANVANKRLRDQYAENNPTYMAWAKRGPNLPDFKARSVVQISGAPDLLPLGEAGEIKHGAWNEQGTTYRLTTYARKTNISRQMLINDDLGALDRWAIGFANAARRIENRQVYFALAGANTYNGAALFTNGAPNSNQAASGAAIGLSTLSAGRAAMRLQKGLQGEELNITPRHLIVPAALETTAEQFVAGSIVPNQNSNVNQFGPGGRNALHLVVDAVLDAYSATGWFLAADSNVIDTIEYAYLDGAEGVQLATRDLGGFQGIEIEAGLDFVAAAIDYRGLYRNAGA